MSLGQLNRFCLKVPEDLIVFISGVPGVGKTTISYEFQFVDRKGEAGFRSGIKKLRPCYFIST